LGIECFLLFYLMIGPIYQYLTIKRTVKETYAALPPTEIEKIHTLQEEIEAVLDPNLPGHSKYIAAWEDWSEPDMQGLQKELKGLLRLPNSPYVMTRYFLLQAELAMRSAHKAKKHPEKQAEKARKAIDLAAMVWGIYWAEEVIKAEKRRK
jgi:hypothetical protein